MKNKEQEKIKVWYKVTDKYGWGKCYSLEQILKDKQNAPYHPVLKIIKCTEELLPQEVIDEINSQVDYKQV